MIINAPWNPAYEVKLGYIYAFWTEERAPHLKIGCTSRHPQDRLAEFLKRYHYEHLRIIFMARVDKASAVELRLARALGPWRVKLHRRDSIEWYQINPDEGVAKIEREIFLAGATEFEKFIDKRLDAFTKIAKRSLCSANKGFLPGRSDYQDIASRKIGTK